MKKLLSVFLVCILLVSTLTGCQNRNTAINGNPSGDSNHSTPGTGKKTIELTLWGAQEDGQLLNELIEGFKAKYASEADFNITVEYHSESSCKDDLFGDVENGADVFTFADDQLRIMVAGGVLDKVPNADTIESANIEAAIDSSSVNDILYAYPMTADNGYFLYYNKDYFSEDDVKSMDSILSIAQASGKNVTMEWSSGWYLYAFFGGTGLEMGLNDDGVSHYCNWNATDTNIKGVDIAQALLNISANPSFLNCSDGDFVKGVQNETVIAGVSGVWNATVIQEAWGDNYAATKLPTYTCAGQQIQMSSFAGYKMVGVNAYSDETEWAHKLADWITNEESQTTRFVKRGQGPSNIKASASPEIAKSPAIQAILEQSEFSTLQRVGGTYWQPMTDFGEIMADHNSGGKDLQELMDKMVKGITAAY